MATQLKTPPPTKTHLPPLAPPSGRQRRSAWRQRLVEAERGMTLGFRGDSSLFFHFFVITMVVATAAVLGITLIEWTILILSLTAVVSAELFNQVLRNIWKGIGHHFDESVRRALRIGTAAVLVTMTGATLTIVLVLGSRLWTILSR